MGEAKFFATVKTSPGAHPDVYRIGAGSFQVVKRPGRGADYPPHLAPRLRKEMIYASTIFVACSKVNFTFTSFYYSFFSCCIHFIILDLFSFSISCQVHLLSISFFFRFRPSHFKKCAVSYHIICFLYLFLSVLNMILSNHTNCLKCLTSILRTKACTEQDTQSWRQSR